MDPSGCSFLCAGSYVSGEVSWEVCTMGSGREVWRISTWQPIIIMVILSV